MAPPASSAPPAPKPPQGPSQSGRRAGGGGGGRGRGRGRERRQGAGAPSSGATVGGRDSAQTPTAPDRESNRRGGVRAADGKNVKRDKASAGGSSKRRGGGSRASTAKPRAPRGKKGSGNGGPAVQKKVLVRNIPHAVTEEEVCAVLETFGVARELVWRFVQGKAHGKNRAPTPARVYLDMKKSLELANTLIATVNGQTWPPSAAGKDQTPAPPPAEQQQQQLVLDVAFAPYQKIPREKLRKDAKAGTIDRDPEFLAFLEDLNRPREKMPSADVVADSTESEQAEKPVAALVKYLNERKTRDKSKGKLGKGDKNSASRRQGTRKKEKGVASKDKSKKERQKKADANASSAGGQDSAKSRKPRGGKSASNKKEAPSKSEASIEPGKVRIMAPKDPSSRSSAGAGASGMATTATRAHTTGEAGPSDKSTQARGQKGAGASGGGARGRGRKENKAAEPTAGSIESNGKSADNSKTTARLRRESRAVGAQSAKPNGGGGAKADKKKRVFAPKSDATGAV